MVMEENRHARDEWSEGSNSHGTFWLTVCSVFVLAAAVVTLVYYNFQQKAAIAQVASQESGMTSTITQLQGQLDSTTAKLNDVSAAAAAANEAAANAAKNGTRSGGGLSRADANRLKQVQAGLDEQKKQLETTQDDVAKTRTDLEGNLNSTRDELNGSIAKTHDELVLLEKRGERSYFEFDAAKSKKFQRTGPLSISLRRADPKHANVDLVVLVNDREISKKKVNLYEPVWIYETQDAQPVQVVVNKIDKNSVHGYISAAKYSAEDLAAGAALVPTTPASQRTDSTDNSNEQ
jgi:hypothetical protein